MSNRNLSHIAVVLCIIATIIPTGLAIDHKCSACRAVGLSLAKTLDKESIAKQGKVVDMRGRLDSKGQRYGKKISYKVSELRFIELLENVCDGEVKKYRVLDGATGWFLPKTELEKNKVKMKGKLRTDAQKSEILEYCHRVIEEAEEDLKGKIYDETLNSTNVEEYLCRDVVKACDADVDFTPKEVAEDLGKQEELPVVDTSASGASLGDNATKRKTKKKSSKAQKRSEL